MRMTNVQGTQRNWNRREWLGAAAAGAAELAKGWQAPANPLAIPGLYPGRVIATEHSGSVSGGAYQLEPIRQMMLKGMLELTGARDWAAAWRQFFSPGDIVGIKLNSVAHPLVISSREVVNLIIDGLTAAGVRLENIVAYDRYRVDFVAAGFAAWLPAGVRTAWAAEAYDDVQQSIAGYDPAHYLDFPVVLPGQDLNDPVARRSHVAIFMTQQVNKVVNLPVLKEHPAAGVTLALKNLSHGLVNNTPRSHASLTAPVVDRFIPAVVSLPVIRDKVVLNILDGIRGVYHAGPGAWPEFAWEHRTMYFATDPVALDRIGWKQIERKRLSAGMLSLTEAGTDRWEKYSIRQPEHIERAGAAGLGVFNEAKIDFRKMRLG